MANFFTVQTRVQNLVGSNAAISAAEIQQIIQAEHETILGDNSWVERKAYGTITTVPLYTTGTITTSGTTVIGSGTTFIAAMVGRYLRIGSQTQYFKITAFTDTTHITIETASPGGDIATATTYVIFQTIYSLPVDAERIQSMVHLQQLTDVPRMELDRRDPYRSVSSSTPLFYSYAGLDSNNYKSIELWPVPNAAALVRFAYYKTNQLKDSTDIPLYRSDVLVWKAASSAAYLLLAKTGDEAWAKLADSYTSQYDKALLGARLDDVGKNSPSHRIRDVMYQPYGYRVSVVDGAGAFDAGIFDTGFSF